MAQHGQCLEPDVESHVVRQIQHAPMVLDPFAHFAADTVFPPAYYAAIQKELSRNALSEDIVYPGYGDDQNVAQYQFKRHRHGRQVPDLDAHPFFGYIRDSQRVE